MAITCPRCGKDFDVTLFQFGHQVRCDCGTLLEYPGGDFRGGHVVSGAAQPREDEQMAEVELGRITHYFGKIGVAAIEIIQDSLAVGDTIRVTGHTSDFTQQVDSMQIDGQSVNEATVGQSIGIKVKQPVREHDSVFKVVQ